MLKILLIDDDIVDRKAILRALGKSTIKAKVREAGSAQEGLAFLDKETCDCVLLDYRLPDKDGLETLNEIQKRADTNSVPVIMLTGMDFDSLAVRTLRAGAQDFLQKGNLSPVRLEHTILCAIERQNLLYKNREYQKALENKSHFQQVISETMADGLFVLDKNKRFISVNPSLMSMVGLSSREIVGRNLDLIMNKADAERINSQLSKFLETRDPKTVQKKLFEVKSKSPKGFDLNLLVSVAPSEENGKPIFVGNITDVTLQRKTEERYKILAENSTDIVSMEGPDEKINYVSPAFEKVLGWRIKEVLGKNSWGNVHPADKKEKYKRWRKSVFEDKKPCISELRFQHKNGSYIWFETLCTPLLDQKGKINGIISTARNIEDRKIVEDRLQLFADNTSDILLIRAPDQKLLYASPALEKQLGFKPKDFYGKTKFELTHPEEHERVQKEWQRAVLKDKTTYKDEIRLRNKKGKYFWFAVASDPVLGPKGEILGVVATLRNIHNQKETENLLKLLADNTSDVLIIRDQKQRAIFVTPSYFKILGIPPEKILNKPVNLASIHPDDHEKVKQWKKVVYDEGKPYQCDVRLRHIDGHYIWFEHHCEPIKDKDGKVQAAIISSRNIEEYKKAETQLRQTQKMKAIGNLSGGVAHDFNNLLTAILGSLQYLKMIEKNLSAESLELLEAAIRSGKKGADLTRQLLALSRKQNLQPKVFNLNKMIQGLLPLFKRTIRENIEIQSETSKGQVFVKVDQGELENCLLNMAVNAQDAMPEGGKLIFETSVEKIGSTHSSLKEFSPGAYAVISVTDTGLGIDSEIHDQIFEPFFTTKDVDKGTGLGLSMVYGFVQQSGGVITFYSEKGKGTTFKIYLPLAQETLPEEPSAEIKIDPKEKFSETILLVEDDQGVRQFIRKALVAQGFKIFDVSNGPDALKIMKKEKKIDLLLTDIVLPKKISGYEIAKEFRKIHSKGKVILSSGYTRKAIMEQGLAEDEDEILSKPFDLEVLMEKIITKLR